MLIVQTQSTDVFRNLAVEELLLSRAAEGPHLLLYRNAEAVVIGKNQNPWRECRLDRLRQIGGVLARRITGGGAVYHDLGNLNYALVYPRSAYRAEDAYALVIAALRALGVEAYRDRKTSLFASGRKLSGSAFAYRGHGVLHHGTLLVHADLSRMSELLSAGIALEESHAVASVPAETINLSDLQPTVSIETLAAALIRSFEDRYGQATPADDRLVESWPWRPLRDRLASEAWVYGRTPTFVARLPSGLRMRVEQGIVRAVWEVCGDAGVSNHVSVREWDQWRNRPFAEVIETGLAFAAEAEGTAKPSLCPR